MVLVDIMQSDLTQIELWFTTTSDSSLPCRRLSHRMYGPIQIRAKVDSPGRSHFLTSCTRDNG